MPVEGRKRRRGCMSWCVHISNKIKGYSLFLGQAAAVRNNGVWSRYISVPDVLKMCMKGKRNLDHQLF